MRVAYFCYHELAATPSRDVYSLSAAHLRRAILRLKSSFAPGSFHLTFDDADVSHFELAYPVLEETGIHGSFFIPTAWVGKRAGTMTWQQLRALHQAGHTLGSHSHTHPLLTQLPASALQAELTRSREILEDQLSIPIQSMSLPGGRSNEGVIQACYAAGFTDIFSSYPVGPTMPKSGIHGRLIVRQNTCDEVLLAYASGDRATLRHLQRAHRLRAGVRNLIGDNFYQMLWRATLRKPPAIGSVEIY